MEIPKRKSLSKEDRMRVYRKYDGHCAYCGKEIRYEDMQVDHLKPLRLEGIDEMVNYMPACRRCNHYKRGNSLEGFREMIEKIPEKLQRDNYIFNVGMDYGFWALTKKTITFYFERDKDCLYYHGLEIRKARP